MLGFSNFGPQDLKGCNLPNKAHTKLVLAKKTLILRTHIFCLGAAKLPLLLSSLIAVDPSKLNK